MSSLQVLEALEGFPAPFFYLRADATTGAPNARWRAQFSSCETWLDVLHPDSRALWTHGWNAQPRPHELEVRLQTAGEAKRCLLRVEALGVEALGVEALGAEALGGGAATGWLIGATDIEDIAARIEADCEQERVALRMTARQWSSFFQKSATGKAMIGLDGEFLVVNPELCRLLGYEEEELLQVAPRNLRYPDDFHRIAAVYREMLAGGPPLSGFETRYLRRDGGVLYALLSISLVQDSREQPLYFAVEMQDDTARRQAEVALEEKVRELATSNADLGRSNAELERFAFIASHDLQEPLRKIRIFTGRLQSEAAKSALTDAGRDYLTRLNASAERMQQLIADLLEFSRLRRPPRFETVDLTRLACDAASDFDTLIEECGGSIEIGALPTLEGDASRLRQLLCNLMGNALKFRGPQAPQVRIWAQAEAIPRDYGLQWWHISVSDNGIGFNESDLPRLLEVFGRLHPREQFPGTGIGLAICRKVAQEHGGDLSARSRPGEGATFIVSLPAKQAAG